MTDNTRGGNRGCPHDSGREQSGRSDRVTESDVEAAAELKEQAGSGTPPEDSSASTHQYLLEGDGETTRRVFEYLFATVDDQDFVKSGQLSQELDGLSSKQIGCSLSRLADRDDDEFPLDIERWTSSASSATWLVKRRVVTDGGQTEFSGSGASPSATDAIIDYLKGLDGIRITTAKRLAPDIDGVGTRTVGIVLGRLAQRDDAPVDVEKWDDDTSGASVWHIDPPNPKVTATDGGPYTVPTGENYVTTYRVNQEIRLTSSDLARVGVEVGDEISALPSRNGIRVVPGEHEDAIQVSEAKKLDGRMLKAEFYRPVMNALGVVTGEDVRIYDVDEEDALEIVAADGDPFVDDDQDGDDDQLVTDGGQDDADVMSGRVLDEDDARHPKKRLDAALKQLRLARDELDEDAFAYHGVEKAIDEAERANEWLDHTPMTDGGQQFYIVDEQRRAIVAGPFPTRIAAQAADEADDPHTIIVSERALDFAKSERPIRDETGDIDVVTDGGLPEWAHQLSVLGSDETVIRCRTCGSEDDDLDSHEHQAGCPEANGGGV